MHYEKTPDYCLLHHSHERSSLTGHRKPVRWLLAAPIASRFARADPRRDSHLGECEQRKPAVDTEADRSPTPIVPAA